MKDIIKTIESIRQSIESESVSYSELAYLYAHRRDVVKYFSDDTLLLESAGIPERYFQYVQRKRLSLPCDIYREAAEYFHGGKDND